MSTRPYRSPIRDEQARRTRAEILEALVDVVIEHGPADLAIREVADRAGVGERTVYRHFPDRQALLDGLMEHLFGSAEWPDATRATTLDQLLDAIPQTFSGYDRTARPTRAAVLLNLDPSRPATVSRRNSAHIADLLRTALPDLDDDSLAESAAALHLLASSRTWLRFRDEDGLTPDQAARAAHRAARALVADLRRRTRRGSTR